jgi:hypothetical protein
MEYKMEKAICVEIAAESPFTAQDVWEEWQLIKSFDLILRAVEFARNSGARNLHYSINNIIQTPGVRTREYEYFSYEMCIPRKFIDEEIDRFAGKGWRLVAIRGAIFYFERRLV